MTSGAACCGHGDRGKQAGRKKCRPRRQHLDIIMGNVDPLDTPMGEALDGLSARRCRSRHRRSVGGRVGVVTELGWCVYSGPRAVRRVYAAAPRLPKTSAAGVTEWLISRATSETVDSRCFFVESVSRKQSLSQDADRVASKVGRGPDHRDLRSWAHNLSARKTQS
jgi:hypothetical protein